MRSQRHATFMRGTFQLSWRSSYTQAKPSHRYSRSSVLRISLVGYYSLTLIRIRVSRAAMGRSLIHGSSVRLYQRCFDCQCRLGDPPSSLLNLCVAFLFFFVINLNNINSSLISGYSAGITEGPCEPHSRREEENVGRATSIRSEKSESGMAAAMGAGGVDALPWSGKECTLLQVYEAYELCFMLHASCFVPVE